MSWNSVRAPFRDPITLALALVFLGLLVYVIVRKTRREGWTFKGTDDSMSDTHREFVKDKCRTMALEQILKRDDWDYLAKYNQKDVKAACDEGAKQRHAGLRNPGTVDKSKCKNGVCPLPAVAATLPCLNKAKTKCCNTEMKECRPVQEGGLVNARHINAENRKDDVQAGRNIDYTKDVYTWGGDCKFVSATQKRWDPNYSCPKEWPFKTGVSNDERLRNTEAWKYQCARQQRCADKVKEYWKKHVPGRAADIAKGNKIQGLVWKGIPKCKYTTAVYDNGWRCPNEYAFKTGASDRADLQNTNYWKFQCGSSSSCAAEARKRLPPAPANAPANNPPPAPPASSPQVVTVYEDANFSGKKLEFGIGQYKGMGIQISSIRVPPGLKATIDNSHGDHHVLTSDVSHLTSIDFRPVDEPWRQTDWNDKIQWITVEKA